MHRSGTSLVTQWLHQCGLMVGESLLGKGIGNDDGHYEDLEFYHFHLSVLNANGLPDSGFLESGQISMNESQKEKANQLIKRRNGKFPQWGWKDPRTCLFLNDYQSLLPKAKYLVIVRDFNATVSSLINREYKVQHVDDRVNPNPGFFERIKLSRKKSRAIASLCQEHASHFLKVWMLYNQNLLKLVESLPREQYMVLSYESLLEQDAMVFDHFCLKWNFTLRYVNFNQIFKPSLINYTLPIKKYIDPDVYNQAIDLQESLQQKLSF